MKIETAYKYKALVTRVVDGDTFDATVDLGYRLSASIRFRVKDYDSPETYRPSSPEEYPMGKLAKQAAELLPLGEEVIIQSVKEAVYNRWEAVVTLKDGRDFSKVMTEMGHI